MTVLITSNDMRAEKCCENFSNNVIKDEYITIAK